ncbi:phage holin family protein [Clostridium felsineum]|uniref:Uncharacterized protein n=2 Tax=Clostridium felsineum TaxID=36839 RepID=A0A1S8L4T4_9CLOT|nr:phage holin family protein [Clostridium felsineum]MCR3761249.1 phage holin family protein [Clostridium felsineum]URZ00656.1 hypothetical protein CLAUR_006440 [Clostridium felsineum]URZ06704.1 hypothetical protein CLROS_020370 [Clostridium felsineum]URZ11737.1 hypothetical protein CROST_024540 [Clostridium felsineum]
MSDNNDNREQHEDVRTTNNNNNLMRWVGRLALFAIILAITSFLTPGFSIRGFWTFIVASVVITALDYLVESFMKVDASPFGKGFKGFIISAIIIYVAQYLVPNMHASIIGALLAALVIGVIDAIIPTRAM